MKAISQAVFGGPEVLETVEVPKPSPRAGQVLVRMYATSVNPADWKQRSGLGSYLREPPFTLGFDVAGTVEAVGAEVGEFRPGDEVHGMVASRTGTYSEYVLARAETLALRPSALDHIRAAAIPTAGLTAWQSLDRSGLRSGERILIHAAAGGVGHLAVQFARLRGAEVIATARLVNHEFVRSLGADEVIDYTTTDFTEAAQDVDVVLDLVGGDYGPRSLRVLRAGGRVVGTQASDAEADPRYERVMGRPDASDLKAIGALCDQQEIRVHIDRVLPLTEIADAHRLSESGRVRGKIVLTPW